MYKRNAVGMILAGAAAGTVTGIFGAGGGMVLIPLLTLITDTDEADLAATSLCIIVPICVVCIAFSGSLGVLQQPQTLPYMIGSGLGGLLAGLFGHKIPAKWLHKGLGILILWGGIRYLC